MEPPEARFGARFIQARPDSLRGLDAGSTTSLPTSRRVVRTPVPRIRFARV